MPLFWADQLKKWSTRVMRVLQFFAESLQALKIPLPPPVITQQPQAARLLVRIAVAEGSSLIVQRNGPVQIARPLPASACMPERRAFLGRR